MLARLTGILCGRAGTSDVIDLGDRVVLRPLPDQPIAELEGKYKERGPRSDRARDQARRAEGSRKG